MAALHQFTGWVAVAICGIVGLWGLVLARRETAPKPFFVGVGVAIVVMLLQVVLGVTMLATTDLEPGDQHTFYGFLIAFSFAFAYFYRAQMRQRPALAYGLLLLFAMGLGLRGIATFGVNF